MNQLTPPKDQPQRPAGVNYPVIVRLVLADSAGEEWRPGTTVKWTQTAVMVGWQADPGDPRSMSYAWLPVSDVRRVIRRPTGPVKHER